MTMLTFALKSSIILALFYWVFFALLSKETFHRLNRITLLSALALSVFLPLTPLTIKLPIVEAAVEVNVEDLGGMAISVEETEASLLTWLSNLPWLAILAFVYYAGVAVSLLMLLIQSVSLMRYMQHGLRHTDAFGNTVILKPGIAASFSIFRTIVMSIIATRYCVTSRRTYSLATPTISFFSKQSGLYSGSTLSSGFLDVTFVRSMNMRPTCRFSIKE